MLILFIRVNKSNPDLTNTIVISLAEVSKHPSIQSYYLLSITVVRQDLKSNLLLTYIINQGTVVLGWIVRR
jgi:hypothetical protein